MMRKLILTAVSAIALGVAGAGMTHAQNYGNTANPSTNTPSAVSPQASQPQMQAEPQGQTGQQASLSRSEIRQAQQQLRAQGICRCRADGVLGPQTKQALLRFQQKQNLPQTATLDQQTLGALMGGGGTAVGSSTPPQSMQQQPGASGAYNSGAGANESRNQTGGQTGNQSGQTNQKY
jgi:peptidoglycan hydrolase-like protein with peptidoglycan-binding domain